MLDVEQWLMVVEACVCFATGPERLLHAPFTPSSAASIAYLWRLSLFVCCMYLLLG